MPHVSKSQLSQLMECPRLYWYTRFAGIQSKTGLGALLGSSFHEVWERYYQHKIDTGENRELEWCKESFKDDFQARVSDGLENESLEPFEKGEDDKILDTGIGLVEAYHPYAQYIDPIAVEQKYELSIPGHDWTLYGYIDLIYKSYVVDENGEPVLFTEGPEEGKQKWVPVVVDLKTTGSTPHQPEKHDEWAQRNEFSQEAIGYALAFRVMFGMIEDRFEYHWAVKLKTPRIVVSSLRFKEHHFSWYMDLAVEQIERIKRGFFERNLNSWLHTPRFCPAWNECHGIVEPPEKKASIKVE